MTEEIDSNDIGSDSTGVVRFDSRMGQRISWVIHDFPQFLQASAGVVSQNRPRQLLPRSFKEGDQLPPSFDAKNKCNNTASLNNLLSVSYGAGCYRKLSTVKCFSFQ